jgi:Protein of unknown function (DUF664)
MEPSSPSFRARPASRPDAAAQTERLTSVRQKLDHQKLDQPSRGQRTRRTVDLSPATHRALDIWQREAADRLGFARVTGQEVISALIELLLTDPKLSAEVTRSIRDRRWSRERASGASFAVMAETQRPNRREQELSGERTTLESFLDDYRDIVVRKVSGLSDTDARRSLVASSTTVGGLIKHLRWAEYGWFEQLLQERNDDNRRTHDRWRSLGLNGTCDKMPPDGRGDGGVLRFAPLGVPVVPLVKMMIDECLLALGTGDLLGLPRDP